MDSEKLRARINNLISLYSKQKAHEMERPQLVLGASPLTGVLPIVWLNEQLDRLRRIEHRLYKRDQMCRACNYRYRQSAGSLYCLPCSFEN